MKSEIMARARPGRGGVFFVRSKRTLSAKGFVGAARAAFKGAVVILGDIGCLSGPVMVFGGPYSNLQALLALRVEADRLGIPPTNVICTGDVVAYGTDPVACVRLVRDWGIAVVAGNVERQLAAGAMNCGCGFDEGSTCDRLSAGWYAYADASCDAEARAWMAALPDEIAWTCGGLSGVADVEVQFAADSVRLRSVRRAHGSRQGRTAVTNPAAAKRFRSRIERRGRDTAT